MEIRTPLVNFAFLSALPRINTVRPGKQSQFSIAEPTTCTQDSAAKAAGQQQAKLVLSSLAVPHTNNNKALSSSTAFSAAPAQTGTVKAEPQPWRTGDGNTSKATADTAPIGVPGAKDGVSGRAIVQHPPASLAPSIKPSVPSYTVAEVLRKVKSLMQPRTLQEHQFYSDCYQACEVQPCSSLHLDDIPEVAVRLCRQNYKMVVRRVMDSKLYWSKSMTSVFCYCVLPGTGVGYVLDPNFKEHFKTGHMSIRYRDIWECLPAIFVGPPAQLIPLVQLLCQEVVKSFEEAGRQLPPWRNFATTIDRWMSPSFKDLAGPNPPSQPAPALALSNYTQQYTAAETQFKLACEAVVALPGNVQHTSNGITGSCSTGRQEDGSDLTSRGPAHAVFAGFTVIKSSTRAGLETKSQSADSQCSLSPGLDDAHRLPLDQDKRRSGEVVKPHLGSLQFAQQAVGHSKLAGGNDLLKVRQHAPRSALSSLLKAQ